MFIWVSALLCCGCREFRSEGDGDVRPGVDELTVVGRRGARGATRPTSARHGDAVLGGTLRRSSGGFMILYGRIWCDGTMKREKGKIKKGAGLCAVDDGRSPVREREGFEWRGVVVFLGYEFTARDKI